MKSSGLLPIYNFALKSPLKSIIDEEFVDKRNQNYIKYLCSEFILSILLRLIDGSTRLYHFRYTANNQFFVKFFQNNTVPHFTTLIYFLNKNIDHAHYALEKIMFRFSVWILVQEIILKKLKTITIDVDATASTVYGLQEGAEKGYNPEKRNARCYQLQVWSIRETKSLLKVELRNGSAHCSRDFLEDLKVIIPELKKLGVKIRIVADSGYEKHEVFDYLDSQKIGFIIAQKQRKGVKTRGKWAKNKKMSRRYDCTLKERNFETTDATYRQIYIQVERVYDENGQLYILDFAADEFTNVFITNMLLTAENIYGLYRKHAQVETIIGELKSGFSTVKSRCAKFDVNQSLAQLCGMAYNLKTFYSSSILKSKDKISDITTLRDEEIHIPGYFANHGGRKIFNVISTSYTRFNEIYSRVANFQSV